MSPLKKDDPTITSDAAGNALAGVHPALPIAEAADAAETRRYRENPDKPDPSTVAQVEAE